MNWYIIFENNDKIDDLLFWFNNQPEMKAFIVKSERFWKKDGKKEFVEMPMYPNYIFVETNLDEKEFDKLVSELDISTTMKVLQNDAKTVMALSSDEKEFLESLLNDKHSIVHSTGIIVDSKLIVQEGPLRGKEDLIKKIDRHKRTAFLGNLFGQIFKVPLEVTSKS